MFNQIIASTIAIAIAATAATAKPRPQANPDAALIAKAKTAVADRTNDPLAAQFRNIATPTGSMGKLVCGEVNAKNRFGGYVGFTRFVYQAGMVSFADDLSFDLAAQGCK